MNEQITLDDWNITTLALMQALLGAVSPNFRMVALLRQKEIWKLLFVLESEDEVDREEIDDIANEFEALRNTAIEYEVEILITTEFLSWPEPPARVVFRRREE